MEDSFITNQNNEFYMKQIKVKTSDNISLTMRNGFNIDIATPYELGEKREEETHRTTFRRERDGILYSGGFRRLQDKTQVMSATKGGDHRTRLTHTLEVEQIATSISDALGLNRDLASAIAYGHDIGHTPFGHAAERTLDELLVKHGGFSHAVQSVRFIKDKNIKVSDIVLEGILKHDSDVFTQAPNKEQFDCSFLNPGKMGCLEAQVVFWADKLAYLSHDFEDFYNNGIFDNLKKNNHAFSQELQNVLADITDNPKIKADIDNFKTRDLIRNLLTDLVNTSIKKINDVLSTVKEVTYQVFIEKSTEIFEKEKAAVKTEGEKEKKKGIKKAFLKSLTINLSNEKREHFNALRKILDDHYIMSPDIALSDAKARKIIDSLFKEFVGNKNLLPLEIKKKIDTSEDETLLYRTVADYICSMTDSYAEEVYFNLNFPSKNYNY